jgi:hypothetical protein
MIAPRFAASRPRKRRANVEDPRGAWAGRDGPALALGPGREVARLSACGHEENGPMFCPKCGEVMIVNDGEVTCVSGDMQLSASMRDGLTEVFVDRRRRGRHCTLNSGGQWFCSGCGAPMKIDGETFNARRVANVSTSSSTRSSSYIRIAVRAWRPSRPRPLAPALPTLGSPSRACTPRRASSPSRSTRR